MTTYFLGGSRRISQLPRPAVEQIRQIVAEGHYVIVGDASGADRAIQKVLHDSGYRDVTVFCSGEAARNNVGLWPVSRINAAGAAKGFQYFAVKDREMARRADVGVMIWDGSSVGTLLNVLRLVRSGKTARVVSGTTTRTFGSLSDWFSLLGTLDQAVLKELRGKATGEEWVDATPASAAHETPVTGDLFAAQKAPPAGADAHHDPALEDALADCDGCAVIGALRRRVEENGIGEVAKRSGLPRTRLEKALAGQPSFNTALKIFRGLGLRLVTAPAIPMAAALRPNRKPTSKKTVSKSATRVREERQADLVALDHGRSG